MRSPAGRGLNVDARPSTQGVPATRLPLSFFLLVFALSAPFWLAGGMTELQLMPGLSVSALMAFCPMAAAWILTHRESGHAGVTELLGRSLDFRRIRAKRWYVPILLLMAVVDLVVSGLIRGMEMPLPAPLMFVAFLIGALGAELGWSGYVTDPMPQRWNALQTSLLLGLVAVLWHLVPLTLMGRSPSWIAWWCLYAMAARILIVWLYNNTGNSVFAVALFHATLNLSWMLFPVNGSHFDMRMGGVTMAIVAAVVTLGWGSSTLTRHQQG